MQGTTEPQTGQAASENAAKRRFRINLVIYLSVTALLIAAWAALTVAGVPIKHTALNLVITLVVMALWGARIALSRHHTHQAHPYTEQQIQREITKLPP
jgi:2TM domain